MSKIDFNQLSPEEKKNSLISAGTTLILLGLILLICAFVGLNPPDPPIPEEGVEVNLGNSETGLGETEPIDNSTTMAQASAPAPSQGERVATQSHSDASIRSANSDTKASNSTVKPTQETKNNEVKEEPKVNTNALFKKNSKGGSQGVTTGDGNQGKEGGNPNSNRYDGTPGNGGAGYSLSGRSASALPQPRYDSQKEGKIIVKIWVNRQGTVTKAEAPQQGSTISEAGMVALAKQAALKAKFTADENATELQVGTITYVFRRNN